MQKKFFGLLFFLQLTTFSYAQDSEQELDENLDEISEKVAPSGQDPSAVSSQFEPSELPPKQAELKPDRNHSKSFTPERMFGSYDLMLQFNSPKFVTTQSTYEKFYGTNANYYTMSVDYYPFDGWVTAGIGFKTGVFYHSGKTSAGGSNLDSAVVLDSSSANLLWAPLQIVVKVQGSPFRKKWVRLSAWGGYEKLYWRESKTLPADDQPSTATTTSTSLTTGGSKNEIILGAAAHFSLNWIDEASVYSMRDTLGIGAVYLSIFYEKINQMNKDGYDFSRNVLGLGFSFETLR